jgi:hypothetical protein
MHTQPAIERIFIPGHAESVAGNFRTRRKFFGPVRRPLALCNSRRPKALSATYPIIPARVGKGGITSGVHVRKIQQLLTLAGVYKGAITGTWTHIEPAWIEFQKSLGLPPKPFVDPMDAEDRLAELASAADTLMYFPSNLRSLSAINYVTDYLIREKTPYGYKHHGGGTKKVWGFEGRPYLMIFGLQGSGEFPVSGVTCSVNCVSFANLLLGAWHGGIHQPPFDSDLLLGGAGRQVGQRYSMSEVLNMDKKPGISDYEYVSGVMPPNCIYHMALCDSMSSLSTKHDVIVVNQMVYQANTKDASTEAGAVYKMPLDKFWKTLTFKHVRLFGPGPY